jgi:hypothetical protein
LIKHDQLIPLESTLSQIQYNFFGTSILSKETEMHGQEIYQGKAAFKSRKLEERLTLIKITGKTPLYRGRPLGRLVDTIYFTHSHHSRFLQVADMVVYMANRYENNRTVSDRWHDQRLSELWNKVKSATDYKLQNWP